MQNTSPRVDEVEGGEAKLTPASRPRILLAHRHRLSELAGQYSPYFALVILCVFFALQSPIFLSSQNVFDVLRQVSVNGILALGATFVILTAGIDLSVGSLLAFVGLISATFAVRNPSFGTVVAALGLPLLIGAGSGVVNGVAVAWGRVTPFIVTLGSLTVLRGAAQLYSVGPIYGLPSWYSAIGQGTIGPTPVPVVIFFSLAIFASLVLNFTRFGRYVYAVGGNEEAARASGINTRFIKVAVYVISGLSAVIASFILTSRVDAAEALAATGYELTAIAAVVVGGTSLFGGRGGVGGTVAGALLIGVLLNGLNLMNVNSFWQQIVIGIIIVAAVGLDNVFRRT